MMDENYWFKRDREEADHLGLIGHGGFGEVHKVYHQLPLIKLRCAICKLLWYDDLVPCCTDLVSFLPER